MLSLLSILAALAFRLGVEATCKPGEIWLEGKFKMECYSNGVSIGYQGIGNEFFQFFKISDTVISFQLASQVANSVVLPITQANPGQMEISSFSVTRPKDNS